MMSYRGYEGTVEFDPEHELLFGKVLHLNDLITFEGQSVDELKAQFRESVDDYLEWCEELGKAPEKPYSGRFLVRMPKQLHRRVASAAARADMSLNAFVVEALAAAVEETGRETVSSR